MSLIIKYIFAGFLSKTLASFDDVITRIPLMAQLTKTRRGRVAFAIGNFFAVTVAIILSWLLSSFIHKIPYAHLVSSSLIFLLAIAVYFDIFNKKEETKIKEKEVQIKKETRLDRFFRLLALGFIISFITLIDDLVVLIPLFFGVLSSQIYAVIGIYISTITQLILMVYFVGKIAKLKHIKEIAVSGLLILSVLVYLQVF